MIANVFLKALTLLEFMHIITRIPLSLYLSFKSTQNTCMGGVCVNRVATFAAVENDNTTKLVRYELLSSKALKQYISIVVERDESK